MDENTIFRPISGLTQDLGTQPEIQVTNPVVSQNPPTLPSEPRSFASLKILKVLLGIVVVLGIIFVVYSMVLPKLYPPKISLTYWGLFEDDSTVSPIIADFEKKYPNVKITYSKLDLEQYKDKLITRSGNGTGPDIFDFHNTWVPQLINLLLPFPNSVISKDDFSKNYYPVVKKDLIKNGAIYGIPSQMDTLSLYTNRSLFQAAGLSAPTTWIKFGDDARQLTVKDGDGNIKTAGAAMGTYDNVTHAPDIISMLFAQDGVNLEDMSSTIPGVNDTLNYYTSFALSTGNVWDDTLDDSIKAFASGTLAMYFGYSGDFFKIKSMNPNLAFDIYQVPNLHGQNITVASYWAKGVSSKTKNQKEAFLFVQYLTSKEVVQKLFKEESKTRVFGEPYARIDLADSLTNSVAHSFVVGAPSAISSYFVDGTSDSNGLNFQADSLLSKVVNSVLKGASPQTAAETLSSGYSSLRKQYGL